MKVLLSLRMLQGEASSWCRPSLYVAAFAVRSYVAWSSSEDSERPVGRPSAAAAQRASLSAFFCAAFSISLHSSL